MKASVQNTLDALDGELLKLLKELEGFDDDALNRQPAAGQWSALQTVHHLMKSEELSLVYLGKKLSDPSKLRPAGMQTRLREWFLAFYLVAPLKFKAPKVVNPEQFPTQSSFRTAADAWLEQRRELRRFLELQPEAVFKTEAYRHPFAGRITLQGMLGFFNGHFRRHRRQIRRALDGSFS